MAISDANSFGTGLAAAVSLRERLLAGFGAEPEWRFGDEDDDIVTWFAGPLATRFMIEEVSDEVPGLAALHVYTVCAEIDDFEQARTYVSELNLMTTFGRWSILNDPDLPVAVQNMFPDMDFTIPYRLLPLTPSYNPEHPSNVSVGVTFIVGDERIEFPFPAMMAMVAATIAKATALVSHDFTDGWGSPAIVTRQDGTWRDSSWNPVVQFFDEFITPHSADSSTPLAIALNEAFEIERQAQFESSAGAWFGSGDASGFTCEVPYGGGPFPMGVIAMTPDQTSPETSTSLVRGLVVSNPHVGDGLLFAMTSGGSNSVGALPDWATCSLLNAQNRIRDEDLHPGFAHAVGSWVPNQGIAHVNYVRGATHVNFIPSGFATMLEHDDLVQFFRVLLSNSARLSWGSRKVLEPFRDRDIENSERRLSPIGLAAGSRARGLEFGEPGIGQDIGARVVHWIWKQLVGGDTEFTVKFNDVCGFRFWMGPAAVDVTSYSCKCGDHDTPGAVLLLESDLGVDSGWLRESLERIACDRRPFGIVSEGGRLIAVAQLHIHSDTFQIGKWGVALAASIALVADELLPADDRGVNLTLPSGDLRMTRDDYLGNELGVGVWDARGHWRIEGRKAFESMELLHAQLVSGHPSFDTTFVDDLFLTRREYSVVQDDGNWVTHSLSGTHGYFDHPVYGPSIFIRTALEANGAIDPYSIGATLLRRDLTVLGGFHVNPEGELFFTTAYPIVLDMSRDYAGRVSFAATALRHHSLALSTVLRQVPEVHGQKGNAQDLMNGIENLVSTYVQIGNASPDLQVTCAIEHDNLYVQWLREWPYSFVDSSPMMSTRLRAEGTSLLGGQNMLMSNDWHDWDLSLIHAVLALSAPYDYERQTESSLLGELAFLPDGRDIDVMYRLAAQFFDVVEDEDGDFVIQDANGDVIAQLLFEVRNDHATWGKSLDVVARMLVPDQDQGTVDHRRIFPVVIGCWSKRDGALEYRISLPPVLTASKAALRPLREVEVPIAAVIAHARACAGTA